MNISIIGGGNIAHALVACMKRDYYDKLFVLTSKPFPSGFISTSVLSNVSSKGKIDIVTSSPEEIIPYSDLIIFTVPAHIRKDYIKRISPYVREGTLLGSFPGVAGFNEEIERYLGKNVNIFASQRVPYIARIVERGKTVTVNKKNTMLVAIKKEKEKVKLLLERLLGIKILLLDSFLEVNLTNSNPLLHSARLYDIILNNRINLDTYFYREWTLDASHFLLKMDEEFMNMVAFLKLKITPLTKHYQVKNEIELTKKIRSIQAFKDILIPKIKIGDAWYINPQSRYFREDIKVSMKYILNYAEKLDIDLPTIRNIYLFLIKEISRSG